MSEKAVIQKYVQDLIEKGYGNVVDIRNNTPLIRQPNINPSLPAEPVPFDMLRNHFERATGLNWDEKCLLVQRKLPNIIGNTYVPNGERLVLASDITGTVKVNDYIPPQFKLIPDTTYRDVQPFIKMMQRFFPVKTELKIVMQYLAHMFQKPQERPSWHLLFSSEKGTGKGYLYSNILMPLLNKWQVKLCTESFSNLFGLGADHFHKSMLVVVDDCDSKSGARDFYGKFKNKLSDEYTTVELKYRDAETVATYARVIINTNLERPFKIPADDRRLFIPSYIENDPNQTTHEFLKTMDNFIANENGLQKIYSYLMGVDISDFNHKLVPPKTEHHLHMIGMGKTLIESRLIDWIGRVKVFTMKDLEKEFSDDEATFAQVKNLISNFTYRKQCIVYEGQSRGERIYVEKGVVWSAKTARELYEQANFFR